MMYVRYPLSVRQVEDLLFERGINVCHETFRYWWNRFGPLFAGEIRQRRVGWRNWSNWRWHLDEVFDRIVELVHEQPDPASLVYTSDAKLRTRVKALGTHVMGSGTLLTQIATLRATMEPIDNGHSPDSADGSARDNHVNEELPTICTTEARNREHSR